MLLAQRLEDRRNRQQLRSRRVLRPLDATHVEFAGRRLVNFAANDYLGLSHHPLLRGTPASLAAGSGAAGLISGYTDVHARAEAVIAAWKRTASAVLLPSGYQANFAAIQTLAALSESGPTPPVQFLLDKLCHASLIDAVRATGRPMRVFPHNRLPKLARLLEEADPNQLQVVITESIFSMDGDCAAVEALAELKRRIGFVLVIDEAHGSGVYGESGAGLLEEKGLHALADISICTFSKAAGGIGAAVCGSKQFCEALLNFGRAYIYSTAVPPWMAQHARAAIQIMRDEPHRRLRVRALAVQVRERLRAEGVTIPDGDSPIIPLILGSEAIATQAAERLLEAGILAVAIRPPTVAPMASRLRITLSSEHEDGEIAHLLDCLKQAIHPVAQGLAIND
jgi:8-amino-7-oxononanoate synthase